MAPMPALAPLVQVYPPRAGEEVAALTRSIVASRRSDGAYELRRDLAATERGALEVRLKELDTWLEPARQSAAGQEVSRMLLGWAAAGRSMTPAEASAIATQYAMALGGVPLWAVKRACAKWASGSVSPSEVGLDVNKGQRINWDYPPSAPMVNIVAREIARPWGEEAARIRKIMASKPALSAPRGDGKGFLRAQEWLASREAEKAAEIESRRWTPDPAKQQAEVLRAWAAMGIEPPALAPGKMLALPTTYISVGWTVHEVREAGGSRRVLLPPPSLAEEAPEVQTAAAGSGSPRPVGDAARAAVAHARRRGDLDDDIPF
jgi:hypothetical protein